MAKHTRKQVFANLIAGQTPGFRNYLNRLEPLLSGANANLPAALAYEFHLTETAHYRTLYGLLVRLHNANAELAKKIVNAQRMTRQDFRDRFKDLFGAEMPTAIVAKVQAAETVRDDMVHGRSAKDAELWTAIQSLTGYAIDLNALVKNKANFEPFGDMRGLVGRKGASALKKGTTRWMLKGMGFDIA
jgi:hypothetical protein